MKYYMVPQFAGVMKDLHARGIPENKCMDVLNVMFEEGHAKTRWGYRQLSANLPLSGPITHIVEFEKIITGDKFLVVCTTRDIYYWDINGGMFVPLTEVQAGAFDNLVINGSDMDVTVTAAIPDYTALTATGQYQIRFNQDGVWTPDHIVQNVVNATTVKIDGNFIWASCANYLREPGGFGVYEYLLLYTGGAFHVDPYWYNVKLHSSNPAFDPDDTYILFWSSGSGQLVDYITPINLVGNFVIDGDDIYINNIAGDMTNVSTGQAVRLRGITGDHAAYNGHVVAIIDSVNIETRTINCSSALLYGFHAVNEIWGSYNNIPFEVNLDFVVDESLGLDDFYSSNGEDGSDVIAGSYEMRLCDSGDMDDIHDSAIIYDDETEDKAIAITNGIQPVRVWPGSGNVVRLGERSFTGTLINGTAAEIITDVSDTGPLRIGMYLSGTGIGAGARIDDIDHDAGTVTMTIDSTVVSETEDVAITAYSYPSIAKYIDYFGSVGAEHVILGNVTDSGIHNAQTIEMSNAGEIDLWGNIYYDLIDTNDPVVGVKRLQTQLVIYKERSITLAAPNASGGNQDPFDFIQNKTSVGTPSIRTVVDMGDYHIFFGWDNVYVFNGIGATAIGSDIMNDMNRGINRPFMNRSFAAHIPNKNLYLLFVPYGFEVENPNRAYVFNYLEKHWTIWELAHEMTAFGTFHQSESDTWDTWLTPITLTGTTTNTSAAVTMASVTGLEVGMVVEATAGIPAATNILAINGLEVTLTNAATATGSRSLRFYRSFDNQLMRWEDLILYEDNERYILGDVDGNIYEISDRYYDDDGTAFVADIMTRDFALSGNPKQNFKLIETVIGICDNELFGIEHSFGISASIDFGVTWSAEIVVDIEDGSGYVEQIVNWIERGRQVRFKIRNIDGSYFRIESLNIGFNDSGLLKTNYN